MDITLNKIKEIIKGEVDVTVDVDGIQINDSLIGAGIDSLDRSSFFLVLEDTYDVEIPDEAIENLDSIADIIKYINSKE